MKIFDEIKENNKKMILQIMYDDDVEEIKGVIKINLNYFIN